MSVAVPTDDPTPREVVGQYLAEQCQVITAADAALRQRVDPVHDTRVAIRRLRSTLRVFGPIFDPSAAAALSTELTWYAALLGAVRDREVLRARLGNAVADLSSGLVLGPVGEHIDRHLESELTYHHEELTRAMRSDRYRALLTSLTEWTEAPPYTTTVDDPQGLVRMADKAAHKAKRRLTEAHTVNDTATALHRARKSAKRARYSLSWSSRWEPRRRPSGSAISGISRPPSATIRTVSSRPTCCACSERAQALSRTQRLHLRSSCTTGRSGPARSRVRKRPISEPASTAPRVTEMTPRASARGNRGEVMQARHWRGPFGLAAVGALALTTALPAAAGPSRRPRSALRTSRSTWSPMWPARPRSTDPNLVNPWGLSFFPTSPLWVSDNGTDVSTLYSGGIHGGTQTINPLVVHIPGGAPTGQVANTQHGLRHPWRRTERATSPSSCSSARPDTDRLVTQRPRRDASVDARRECGRDDRRGLQGSGAQYGQPAAAVRGRLLVARVDVYNGMFRRVITRGNFQDAQLPSGFAPFNVAVLGGKIYVAYAKQDAKHTDEVAGAGLGRVDIFTLNGRLVARATDHSALNAPWGLAIAPAGFGTFSGDLLVGNFGDGRIHVYDPTDLSFIGTLTDAKQNPIAIDGLVGTASRQRRRGRQ